MAAVRPGLPDHVHLQIDSFADGVTSRIDAGGIKATGDGSQPRVRVPAVNFVRWFRAAVPPRAKRGSTLTLLFVK